MIRSLLAQFNLLDKIRFIEYLAWCLVVRLTGYRSKRTWLFSIAGIRYRIHAGLGELKIIHENTLRHIYTQYPGFEPQPGWTVTDVGANIGSTSLFYASAMKDGKLIAVEPHPATLDSLSANLKLNPFGSIIEIENSAISREDGTLSLFVPEDGTMAMQVGSGLEKFQGKVVELPCKTLDSLLQSRQIQHVDLLKIDIEGYELDALLGANEALTKTDRVVLEYHSPELRAACWEHLEQAGFKVRERETILYAHR